MWVESCFGVMNTGTSVSTSYLISFLTRDIASLLPPLLKAIRIYVSPLSRTRQWVTALLHPNQTHVTNSVAHCASLMHNSTELTCVTSSCLHLSITHEQSPPLRSTATFHSNFFFRTNWLVMTQFSLHSRQHDLLEPNISQTPTYVFQDNR